VPHHKDPRKDESEECESIANRLWQYTVKFEHISSERRGNKHQDPEKKQYALVSSI
jgi:hypothetical protein